VALGRDTRLLVMDEPAANLDPSARGAFFELLAERGPETTMILSSHRLDEVATLVGRVVELDHGRVVLDDRFGAGPAAASQLACRVELRRPEPAFARALLEWGLSGAEEGVAFAGRVAAPDRLRFLALLSRWAGQVRSLRLEEAPPSEATRTAPRDAAGQGAP